MQGIYRRDKSDWCEKYNSEKKRLKMIILERRNQGGEKEEFLEKRKSHAQRLFPRRDILCLEPQMTPRWAYGMSWF